MSNSPAPSILVVLTGALGDIVRGMALVAPIKRKWPDSTITWLVEEGWKDIVELHSGIDQLVLFCRKDRGKGILRTISELRGGEFDICLDLQRNLKSGVFSLSSGAKRRIGFNRRNGKELNHLFNNEEVVDRPLETDKFIHYQDFLVNLGVVDTVDSSNPQFGLEDVTLESVGSTCSTLKGLSNYIGIIVGSSWESKDWLPSGYVGLIGQILDQTRKNIVLLGAGGKAKEDAEKILSAVESERVINLVNKTSLKELVAVIKGADSCVGPDSGPAHISSAVGTSHVTLFGPSSPIRTAPVGSGHLVVKAELGCMPCYKRQCPGLDKLCMRLISVESVWEKLKKALLEG